MFKTQVFLFTCFVVLAKTNDDNCLLLLKQVEEFGKQELVSNVPCLTDLLSEAQVLLQNVKKIDDLKNLKAPEPKVMDKFITCLNTIDKTAVKTSLYNLLQFVVTIYEDPNNKYCFHDINCREYDSLKLQLDQFDDMITYYLELVTYAYRAFKNIHVSRRNADGEALAEPSTNRCSKQLEPTKIFEQLRTISKLYPEFNPKNAPQIAGSNFRSPIDFKVPDKCTAQSAYFVLYFEYTMMQFQDESKFDRYLIEKLNSQTVRDAFKILVENIHLDGCVIDHKLLASDQCEEKNSVQKESFDEFIKLINHLSPLIKRAFESYNEHMINNEVSCGYDGSITLKQIALTRKLFEILA